MQLYSSLDEHGIRDSLDVNCVYTRALLAILTLSCRSSTGSLSTPRNNFDLESGIKLDFTSNILETSTAALSTFLLSVKNS